ncbi:MAG: hypothetical protein R3E68_09670 [Burkholderiaceae bacterium]
MCRDCWRLLRVRWLAFLPLVSLGVAQDSKMCDGLTRQIEAASFKEGHNAK